MTVPGVYSPEQIAAHVERVIASDGVDESRAIEAMADAMQKEWQENLYDPYAGDDKHLVFKDELARAALKALREMEGE